LAALAIGRRDARLLAVRELTLGPSLTGVAECPNCRERLEFGVTASDLDADELTEPVPAERTLEVDGFRLRFRMPTSLDLAAVARCEDVKTARDRLLQRCVLEVSRGGDETTADTLPESAIEALDVALEESDPLGNIQLVFDCPQCHHHWSATLDVAVFFWTEISGWAMRLMSEVHGLARAYGWSEADILVMSPARRQYYLEMVS